MEAGIILTMIDCVIYVQMENAKWYKKTAIMILVNAMILWLAVNYNNAKKDKMSLDVYLIPDISDEISKWEARKAESLAQAGTMKGLIPLIEQYYEDRKPKRDGREEYYWANITNNLSTMAKEAGVYYALWRPEEIGKTKASEIIELLELGLADLKARPEYFKQFNAKNGWGMYEHFVPFVEKYLAACKEYPDAIIDVSR